jgi:hypothetical protein
LKQKHRPTGNWLLAWVPIWNQRPALTCYRSRKRALEDIRGSQGPLHDPNESLSISPWRPRNSSQSSPHRGIMMTGSWPGRPSLIM